MVDFLRWLAGLDAEELQRAKAALVILGDSSQSVEARVLAAIDLLEIVARHTGNTIDDAAVRTLRALQGTPAWQWVLSWFTAKTAAMAYGATANGLSEMQQDIESFADVPQVEGPAGAIPIWQIVQACVVLWQLWRKLR